MGLRRNQWVKTTGYWMISRRGLYKVLKRIVNLHDSESKPTARGFKIKNLPPGSSLRRHGGINESENRCILWHDYFLGYFEIMHTILGVYYFGVK